MIIEEIEIKNYQCYFDSKIFRFSKGLNLILGKNGDGKTKFYEAIDWLFSDQKINLESLVSAKAIHQLLSGDTCQVLVRITVNQSGQRKTIKKYFYVSKDVKDTLSFTSPMLEGKEEENDIVISPERLRDIIFDPRIRQYSMFKGESQLNIFENKDALNNLINLFSDVQHLDTYIEKSKYMFNKADRAVSNEAKKNKTNQTKYIYLEKEIDNLKEQEKMLKFNVSNAQKEIINLDERINKSEEFVDNGEKLEIYNQKINLSENKISKQRAKIENEERYTTHLFDDTWILVYFEPIFKDFKDKVALVSKTRRKLSAEHNKELGRKQGEIETKEKILKSIPLPIGTPSVSHMEEMLNDELCKVCNREAPKNSEAYNYMLKRLEEFLKSQEVTPKQKEEQIELFKYDYTRKLVYFVDIYEKDLYDIKHLYIKIKDSISFVDRLSNDLQNEEIRLQSALKEKAQLISSSSIEANSLSSILTNYKGFQQDKSNKTYDLNRFKIDLEKCQKELDVKQNEKDELDKNQADVFLLKTKEILNDLFCITKDIRDQEFDEFVNNLEQLSNKIFIKTNQGSFTGVIKFYKFNYGDETKIDIILVDAEGKKFNGNSAQITLLHISVLLAISELVKEADNQSYPIIMDAPVSNFDEMHSKLFFEAIQSSVEQSILLLKDYVIRDDQTNRLKVKEEFNQIKKDKAFWIKLEEPYENKKLHTINTQIIEL